MAWSLDGEFIFTCNNQGEIEKLSMSKEKSQTIALPASLENFKSILLFQYIINVALVPMELYNNIKK